MPEQLTTPPKKHPGGRPPKEAARKRSRKAEVSFTESELSVISDAAEAVGEPVATYVRRVVLYRAKEDLARAAQSLFRR
jgi:hypothetical protein